MEISPMSQIFEIIAHPYTQAVFWFFCIAFAVYFAFAVKKMSFGKDTGTRAWTIIAIALFILGFRVSMKILPEYNTSYALQVIRFSIGLIGIILLFFGFNSLKSSLRKLWGVCE
jgi:hypothetical protein